MKKEDWEELEPKAASTIRLSFAPQVKYQVLTEVSSTKMWEKLKFVYMSRSLSKKLCLKADLFDLKMKERADLNDHIAEFNRLVT